MITPDWIKKAKKGQLDDTDSSAVILSCYQIFGEDLGIRPRPWTEPSQPPLFKEAT